MTASLYPVTLLPRFYSMTFYAQHFALGDFSENAIQAVPFSHSISNIELLGFSIDVMKIQQPVIALSALFALKCFFQRNICLLNLILSRLF